MKRWILWAISKKNVISVISIAKPKNIVVIVFTYVLESFTLFYGNFCMDLYSVDSDEAMCMRILLITVFETSFYMYIEFLNKFHDIRNITLYTNTNTNTNNLFLTARYMIHKIRCIKIHYWIIVPHHEFRNIFLCENYCVCSHHDIQIFLWLIKNYNIYSNTIYVSYTYY